MFFHDVPDEIVAELMARGRDRSSRRRRSRSRGRSTALARRCPTAFLLCRDDHFFPADFQRRIVRERLGIIPDEMDGGHLPALSRPADLVDHLEAIRVRLTLPVE